MIRSPRRRLIAVSLTLGAALLGAEGLLRHTGFVTMRMPRPAVIAADDPLHVEWVADADLFWTLRPDTTGEAFGVRFAVNALGTRGALPEPAHRADELRIVCLGDSTGFGDCTAYPEQLQAVLAGMLQGRRIAVINASVPGYTSFQGVRMLRRLAAWRPDVVTFCFGASNGDVPADGLSDARRAGVAGSPGQRLAARSRVMQWLRARLPGLAATAADAARVSPIEHRQLLRDASAACVAMGARLIAITEPHALRDDPDDDAGASSDPARATRRRHLDAANYALRHAATALDLPLFDLATRLEAKPEKALFRAAADHDASLTNPIGARVVAEEIAAFLVHQNLVPGTDRSGDPPRFGAAASPFAMIAAERSGTAIDQVFLATTVDDLPRAAWFDPRTATVDPLTIDLPPPTASFSMAQVPALANQVIFTIPTQDGGLLVCDLRADGTAGRLHLRTQPLLPGASDLRITPVDVHGDGRPEYVIGFGPLGPPALAFLTEDLRITSIRACPGFDATGLHLAAGHVLHRQRQHLLIGAQVGPPVVRVWGDDRAFEAFATAAFGIANGPVAPIVGHFLADPPLDGVVVGRGPLLMLSRGRDAYDSPCFPFGGVRVDPRTPALCAARVLGEDGRQAVWLGSRAGGVIHLLRIDGDTVSALAPLSCADAE